MTPSTGRRLIDSHLLILQTKRLMLLSLERRLKELGEELLPRVEKMRAEAEHADDAYRTTVLKIGSPAEPEYWMSAYGSLIDLAGELVSKLRAAAPDLPAAESYEAAADVEMLEGIIERWSASMRETMQSSVA